MMSMYLIHIALQRNTWHMYISIGRVPMESNILAVVFINKKSVVAFKTIK